VAAKYYWLLLAIVAGATALLLACGGGKATTPAPTATEVPTDTPAEAHRGDDTSDNTPPLSYDDEVQSLLADLSDSQNAVADSFEKAEPLSDEWKKDLGIKLQVLAAFYPRILKLDPPDEMKGANDVLVLAAFELQAAADTFTVALTSEEDNISMFERGSDILADALGQMVSAASDLGIESSGGSTFREFRGWHPPATGKVVLVAPWGGAMSGKRPS
jgi:hypothetical protein